MGFDLLHADRTAMRGWAKGHDATCTDNRDGFGMTCAVENFAKLPQSAYASGGGSLFLRFDLDGKLRSVTAVQDVAQVEIAVATLGRILAQLEERLGPPQKSHGELAASYLGRGALAQIAREYAFSDYAARISGTHMGKLGTLVLSQTYTSLRD